MSANEQSELGKLKQALTALQQMRAKLQALQQAKFEPIAIVGMACRFPGGVNSPQEYWDLLKAGRDAITEVPPGRFTDDGVRKIDQANVPALKWGGFLDQVDQFDPSFFGIAPREAVAMDPQQRILLEVVWEALEAGGFVRQRLVGSRTGVFVGMHSHSFDYYMLQKDLLSPGSPYVGTGTAHNVAAGRLSYWFDWHAPSITVDTACSSSLTAVHLAVQSLRAGECDLCVAAGVNVLLAPEFTIHASRMDMLAPDGRCKPFDERADGFVRSEGCGAVLLKRLSNAQADGNRILAVIRGSATSHDGHSNGLTAPNGLSQQAAIRLALEQANVPPAAIEYVETHGTGTGLGDPIEAEALSEVLGDSRQVPCAIGSAKANIGHSEGASGIAGLIKTVLSLQQEAIPPLCHFRKLSPHIPMREGFVFPTCLQPWPRGSRPRYAGVSSFGWSGTNVHVVLQEAPAEPAKRSFSTPQRKLLALPLSAHDEPSLRALAASYEQFLSGQASHSLWDICYTAAVARTHHEHRLVVFGETSAELTAQLSMFVHNEASPQVIFGKANPNAESKLAFTAGSEATCIGAGAGVQGYSEPLRELSELYVRGNTVDWNHVYPVGQLVDLPSYPWQRKRYWFQESSGMSRPKHPTNEISHATSSGWFYQLNWEEKLVPLADGDEPREVLESLAQDYAANALRALGFSFEVGAALIESELFTELGIVEKYQRLFHRMLVILEEGQYLAPRNEGWVVARPPVSNPPSDSDTLASRYPAHKQEFGLLIRCGRALPEILRGESDPLELLFPVESDISATMLYRNSSSLRFYNEVAANLARRAATQMTGRPLRILEVGAGTGATTACLLQQLAHEDIDFTVTDISPTLLKKAAALLRGNNSLRYEVLDIESDPTIQKFTANTFDLVVCANVLHATKDLSQTLSHVRKLLKKDGLLLLLEATAPRAWVDLTFGLTDGWWRFADTDLRPSYPLLTTQRWTDLLRESGFPQCDALGSTYSRGAALEESILVAQPDGTPLSFTGQNERWAILADDSDLAEQIAEKLQTRKHECVLVRHGSARNAINPAKPDDYINFFANQPPFDGVLHLWNLDIPANSVFTLDTIKDAQTLGLGSVVNLVRALGDTPAKIWIVTRHAQPIAPSSAPASVGQAPAWGFGRGLAIEELQRWGGLIDIDDSDPGTIVDGVVREICDPDGEDQIALRSGRRYVARLMSATEPPPETITFRKDATYLVTGGMGGLGRKLAGWMAQRGAGHLVLIGRSGVPERSEWDRLRDDDPSRTTVNAIRAAERFGAHVTVERVDVGNPESVSTLLHHIDLSGRPLTGIIHCATAIDFRPITAIDSAAWESMFRAKTHGAWILHELTRSLPLDFFILFSSAACQLGAKDLAHYAAANQFLDGLASYRRSLNLPALSVAWGEWDETRSLTKEQREFFQRSGLVPMDSNLAFQAMFQLAAAGVQQRMVANIDSNLLKPAFELCGRRPFLDYVGTESPEARESTKQIFDAQPPPQTSAVSRERRSTLDGVAAKLPVTRDSARPPVTTAPPPETSVISLLGMTPEDQRELVAARVMKEVAQVLGIDVPDSIDPDRGLFDMGMDSLMSVQLRKRLEASFGRTLPKMLTFTYPSPAAITRYLLGDSLGQDKAPLTRKVAVGTTSKPISASDADATTALMRELESLPPELRG
jgi:acyl transferase domain-containing protein/acyl carrier protein